MENKQFWKVLYEHLERAATYAGMSPFLSLVITVTQLMGNYVTVFHVPQIYVWWGNSEPVQLSYLGQEWRGLGGSCVSCPKHQAVGLKGHLHYRRELQIVGNHAAVSSLLKARLRLVRSSDKTCVMMQTICLLLEFLQTVLVCALEVYLWAYAI